MSKSLKESLKTKIMRIGFNFFPAYRRSGGRITFISHDMKTVRIKVPLNWKTKNIVGTLYGGSMYGAIDPVYMVMFMKILGPEYIVWDKSARIDYKRPGKDVITGEFSISDELIEEIKQDLLSNYSITKNLTVNLLDKKSNVCAEIEKTLYFRKKG